MGMNHKWEKIELKESDTGLKAKFICVRGDCKCVRTDHKYYNYSGYIRSGQVYDYCPPCFGDVLINEQGID